MPGFGKRAIAIAKDSSDDCRLSSDILLLRSPIVVSAGVGLGAIVSTLAVFGRTGALYDFAESWVPVTGCGLSMAVICSNRIAELRASSQLAPSFIAIISRAALRMPVRRNAVIARLAVIPFLVSKACKRVA